MSLPVKPTPGGLPDKPNAQRASGLPARPGSASKPEERSSGLPVRPTLSGLPATPQRPSNALPTSGSEEESGLPTRASMRTSAPSGLPVARPANIPPAPVHIPTPAPAPAPQGALPNPVVEQSHQPTQSNAPFEFPVSEGSPQMQPHPQVPAQQTVSAPITGTPAVSAQKDRTKKRKTFKETSHHDPKLGKQNKGSGKILRVAVLSGLAVLCLLGAKSAFFPPQPPSTEELTAVVKEEIGTTGFPRELGEGFALAFAKAYFSDNTNTGLSQEEVLQQYAGSSILTSIVEAASPAAGLQVTEGPYIAGIREIDENNAIYTVKVLLSNKKWLHTEIPVQWTNAGAEGSGYGPTLSVSGLPTVVPAPNIAEPESDPEPFAVDEEATKAFTEAAPIFFKAWAESNPETLPAFTVQEGSSRVNAGLYGAVIFNSVNNVKVSPIIEGLDLGGPSSTYGVREARVVVSWNLPGTAPADSPDSPAQYSSEYLMAVTYDSTAEKWVVFDIRSAGLPQN